MLRLGSVTKFRFGFSASCIEDSQFVTCMVRFALASGWINFDQSVVQRMTTEMWKFLRFMEGDRLGMVFARCFAKGASR